MDFISSFEEITVLSFLVRNTVKHVLLSVRGYSHDTGMSSILEQDYSISIYFSVFVYLMQKQHFVPVQNIPE